MNNTLWFDRRPGDTISVGTEEGDSFTLLVADTGALPDWVRTPQEIGGQKLKILRGFIAQCPMCKNENLVRHLECADTLVPQDARFFVAECSTHGFAWYKKNQ